MKSYRRVVYFPVVLFILNMKPAIRTPDLKVFVFIMMYQVRELHVTAKNAFHVFPTAE